MENDAISRSKLITFVKEKYHDIVAGGYPYNIVAWDLVRIIENFPALDVAPVVRCRDCKHAMPITNPLFVKAFNGKAMACSIWRGSLCCGLSVVYPNEYCSDGARMDGEE